MRYDEQVYELLKKIPKGKVTTYGDLAEALGNRKLARAVGNILHKNPDPIGAPCYKVVNAQGKLAQAYGYGGIGVQREKLQNDGIIVENDRVDLAQYRYRFGKEPL